MPVVYPVWLCLWFEIPASRVISFSLSLFYWLILGSCVMAGYGLWVVSRWSWYVFLAANLLLVYETAFIAATFGDSRSTGLAFLLSVLVTFIFLIRIGNELRVPYFLPNIRWWEIDPARKIAIPTIIYLGQKDVEGEIVDLAMQGCFVKCAGDFRMNEKIALKFTLFGNEMEAIGYVVWCAQSAVTHPKGIGVKFDFLAKPNRRRLRASLSKIRKMSVYGDLTMPLDKSVELDEPAEDDVEEQAVGHAKS
jgi:hypothetical protein